MPITRSGEMQVDVALTKTPDGADAVLLQLPDGFVLMPRVVDVRTVGESLIAAAAELEQRQAEGPGSHGA